MNRVNKISGLTLFSVLLLTSCQTTPPLSNTNSLPKNSNSSTTVSRNANSVEEPHIMGNPAAVNCATQGGTMETLMNPKGGSYGVCVFEDNKKCEEWALMNGECPTGGLKVTGYENDAQIFCVITGGTVQMDTKPATCELPTSLGSCSLDDYFAKGQTCAAPMAGSERDEHGCFLSQGYSWCEALKECIHAWETQCPKA